MERRYGLPEDIDVVQAIFHGNLMRVMPLLIGEAARAGPTWVVSSGIWLNDEIAKSVSQK